MIITPENIRAENDAGWKHILTAHLKDFVEFFWQEAYQDIDWSRPYEILEQELMSIGIKERNGNRYLDKLFKVFLNNGHEQWLLLHIEIQHSKTQDFPERMFTYFYRIYDRYQQDIASMAILVDKDKNWRPHQYRRGIWKSEIIRTYEVIKLIDYQSRIEELKRSDNPFALVILIQLAAMGSKPEEEKRLLTKLEFFRYLHLQGWPIEKSMNMYRFLDTLLSLNPIFEVEYFEKAKEIDGEFNMQFTLTAERLGFAKGIQEGIEQGLEKGIKQGLEQSRQREVYVLTSILKTKFKEVPEDYLQKINDAETDILSQWIINSISAESIGDIFSS